MKDEDKIAIFIGVCVLCAIFTIFSLLLHWRNQHQAVFYASNHEEEICGTVMSAYVAGGWRQANLVYSEVEWDDGSKTHEDDDPRNAPFEGQRICKTVWVKNN